MADMGKEIPTAVRKNSDPLALDDDDKPVDVKVFEGATLQIAPHDSAPGESSQGDSYASEMRENPSPMSSELSRNRKD